LAAGAALAFFPGFSLGALIIIVLLIILIIQRAKRAGTFSAGLAAGAALAFFPGLSLGASESEPEASEPSSESGRFC